MWNVLLTSAILMIPAQAPTPTPAAHDHDHAAVSAASAASAPAAQAAPLPRDENLPPSQDQARAALEKSTRHGEYVDIKLPSGGTPIRAWVVYPERKDRAGAVIVIHDIGGLSDWIRGVGDQLARDGFIAVVPDLVSGKAPNGGGTEATSSRDEVSKLVRGLTPEEATARLNAVHAYAARIPAANGKTSTLGFCWGGAQSFSYAVAQPELDAAVVFYGTSPETADLAKIKAPVLGLYGSDDARVNVTVPPAEAEMKRLGKTFETHTFEGAGHGFTRSQEAREANHKAVQQAWPKVLAFLRNHLK